MYSETDNFVILNRLARSHCFNDTWRNFKLFKFAYVAQPTACNECVKLYATNNTIIKENIFRNKRQ